MSVAAEFAGAGLSTAHAADLLDGVSHFNFFSLRNTLVDGERIDGFVPRYRHYLFTGERRL